MTNFTDPTKAKRLQAAFNPRKFVEQAGALPLHQIRTCGLHFLDAIVYQEPLIEAQFESSTFGVTDATAGWSFDWVPLEDGNVVDGETEDQHESSDEAREPGMDKQSSTKIVLGNGLWIYLKCLV